MAQYLSRYAQACVPRYTSYPPANRFGVDIDEVSYRRWLADMAPDTALSLYVHIPFCHKLCWYCGCHTTVPNLYQRVDPYLNALRKEMAIVSALVPKSANVINVHFGGGSPNFLHPEAMAELIYVIKNEFNCLPRTRFSFETDPRHLSDDHLAFISSTGNARLSLGVQDVSEDVQALINRIQPIEVVQSAVERARRAGISNLNIDLMYGLPGQTVNHVELSARAGAELAPEQLSVFGYTHVPWFKKNQRAIDESRLPPSDERFEQHMAIAGQLNAYGYTKIGLDHFARPEDPLAVAQRNGQLRRNFQGYTDDPADAIIGFGASSISECHDGYAQNLPRIDRYMDALAAGHLPIARGIAFSETDRTVRYIIERLMCDLEINTGMLGTLGGGEEICRGALEALNPLIKDGLAEWSGPILGVTDRGQPYVRNIAACFDPCHRANPGQHSIAV